MDTALKTCMCEVHKTDPTYSEDTGILFIDLQLSHRGSRNLRQLFHDL